MRIRYEILQLLKRLSCQFIHFRGKKLGWTAKIWARCWFDVLNLSTNTVSLIPRICVCRTIWFLDCDMRYSPGATLCIYSPLNSEPVTTWNTFRAFVFNSVQFCSSSSRSLVRSAPNKLPICRIKNLVVSLLSIRRSLGHLSVVQDFIFCFERCWSLYVVKQCSPDSGTPFTGFFAWCNFRRGIFLSYECPRYTFRSNFDRLCMYASVS